jgi:hypothetical protein
MGAFNSRRNLLFAAVVASLVLVMVYFNFVSPIREERVSKEKLLAQKQKELEVLKKRTEGAAALSAEEQVNLAKARNRVPEVPDLEGLLRDVRMLETVSKIQLASYNFEVGKQAEQVGQTQAQAQGQTANGESAAAAASQSLALPIKLNTTTKGDYQQVHRFLEELQSTNRLMQIDKIAFAVKSTAPVKLNATRREITVNLSMVSYFAPGLLKFYKTPVPVHYNKPEGKSNPIY